MSSVARDAQPPIDRTWSAAVAKATNAPLLDVRHLIADRDEQEGKEAVANIESLPDVARGASPD